MKATGEGTEGIRESLLLYILIKGVVRWGWGGGGGTKKMT